MANDEKQSGNWGARFLIIIFGVGIVAIGLHPIQQRYGSILAFFSHITTVQAKSGAESVKSSRFFQSRTSRNSRLYVKPRSPGEDPQKQLDQLTNNDRKALENLLGGL